MAADRKLVAHLLRRATFGPTAAEIDAAASVGVEATVDALVAPTGVDPGATPVPVLGPDPASSVTKESPLSERAKAEQAQRVQVSRLIMWWLARMVLARHQLTEKLIFFWHGHWATSAQKVRSAQMMLGQLETFRRDGHGDFAVLLKAMLRDPALILWLDGPQNSSRAPNENLARELMELFTLGIGAYTEDDVKQGARALTGWTIDRPTLGSLFVPRRHDAGLKTILGRTDAFDADSFADLLVAQPAHPAFLARRLWFRFAAGDPVPSATMQRLVAAYGPQRDISALVRAVLTDEAFPGTRRHLVKQPVEWFVGALRQLGVDPTRHSLEKRYQFLSALEELGQVPLRPPSVGGWPAGASWLTTSSTQARVRAATLIAGQVEQQVLAPLATGTADGRIAALARLLAVDAWTERTRAALRPAATNPRRLLTVGLVSPEYTVT